MVVPLQSAVIGAFLPCRISRAFGVGHEKYASDADRVAEVS